MHPAKYTRAWPQHPATSPQQWVAQMGYNDLVTFTSTDQAGGTVYHTNVMMAIGTGARQQASWKGLE